MSAALPPSATGTIKPVRHWWVLHALGIGAVASAVIHIALGALHFKVPEITLNRQQDRGLEIVLVNAKHAEAPKEAQALAQANLSGGGTVDQKVRTTSPLPSENTDRAGDALVEARRRQQQLETLQKQLMTQAKGKAAVPAAPETPAAPQPDTAQPPTPDVNGIDFKEQARAIARQEAIVDRLQQAYAQRPRKTFIGARTQEYRFAQYIEEWRTRIQRIGTLNYPVGKNGNRLYGNLLVTVEIKSDGTVQNATVTRSSGKKELDESALRIIQLASPFAAFPPDIRKDTDILVISRTWSFARDTLATE